jgi:hypothetical protein
MSMKMVVENLEYARNFERLAAHETNPDIKAVFERQAAAYRARAAAPRKKDRASGPPNSDSSN